MAGVYLGMDSAATGGIEICSSAAQYNQFTGTSSDYSGRINYISNDSSFKCYVGANPTATPNLKLSLMGLSVSRAAISSDKRLKLLCKALMHEML